MKTITLSDHDVNVIVDALRFKSAVLISELLREAPPPTPPQNKPVFAKYGFKADGTPRKAPGRPRKQVK